MLLPSCLNVDLQMPFPNSIIIEEDGVAKELCLSLQMTVWGRNVAPLHVCF